ncbi:hypothetical protein [Chryseobacterium lactis]|nr:hypothetical protein [Chryseobacterium lactis]
MRNHALRQTITGQWTFDTYSDSDKAMFEHFVLDLKNEDDSIKGRYCATADEGKKLDCSTTEYNIHGRIADGKITAEFYSFLGSKDNKGIAEIKLINTYHLEWKIIKSPRPPFHFPKHTLFDIKVTSRGCVYTVRKTDK